MKNSLIDNLLYNEKRQKESIKLFEISDIYSIDSDGEIVVNKYLGIIVSGRVEIIIKNSLKNLIQNI